MSDVRAPFPGTIISVRPLVLRGARYQLTFHHVAPCVCKGETVKTGQAIADTAIVIPSKTPHPHFEFQNRPSTEEVRDAAAALDWVAWSLNLDLAPSTVWTLARTAATLRRVLRRGRAPVRVRLPGGGYLD